MKSITREDLLSFHAAIFRPDQAVLGIWGDFDAVSAKLLIEQCFGDWSPSPAIAAPPPMRQPVVEEGLTDRPTGIYIVDRPGLTQGYVRMAELGTTLTDPDVFALDVLNSLLNGFGGRLFDEVRSREGLAYSVYGGWSPSVEHRGSFVAGGETRISAVPQFIQAVRRVLINLTVDPPSEEDLLQAKDSALNSFVFNFATSGGQLSRIMTYELFGVDQDYLFQYKRAVEAITGEDVLRAAQRHLHPLQQVVLVVTDAKYVKNDLEQFNSPVIEVPLE